MSLIVWDSIVSILYPRRCPVCGDIVIPASSLIHPACLSKLSPVKSPTCQKCGKEVFNDHQEYCYDCTRHQHSFEFGMSLLNYNEPARHSLAAIKYKNKREYLDFYTAALNLRFGKAIRRLHAAALVPIPVHPARLRHRGFNQAEELAVRLSPLWNLPVLPLLIRSKKTAPQRDLNPAERLKNLQQAFAVPAFCDKEGHPIPLPQTIILIDDIYTTGSTIEACTRVLHRAGVSHIYFVTICIGASS